MNPNKVYLTQTDTTVGFLSQNREKLNIIKQRPVNQAVLREVDSLKTLKKFVRIPKKHRNLVRRAKKTTFIYPNKESFRVVKDEKHLEFLSKFEWMYSTSANLHSQKFDESWARKAADIIVENKQGFFEGKASKIYKINSLKIKKIR